MENQKVTIIGLGYVGIPLLIAAAQTGKYTLHGFDTNLKKIEQLQRKENPIDDVLVDQLLSKTTFSVSTNSESIRGSEYILITVPTPVLDDFTPDYSFVSHAAEIVAQYIEPGQKIVLESTVNPGVTEEVLIPILEEKSGLKAGADFDVAFCPERINPGDLKWNVTNIPRNLGATRYEAAESLKEFYKSFITADVNIVSSIKVAEATKIVENTFRDVNIAFVNELAQSFDRLGIDVKEVIDGAANKPFGFMAHYPSIGVGGHCIPVDPYYLIERAKLSGFNHQLLKIAREVNNDMPRYTVRKLSNALNDIELPIKNTSVLILGISYKADVGDLRESPVLKMRDELITLGANVGVYDPYVTELNEYTSLEEALKDKIAVVLATPHSNFLDEITPELLAKNNVRVFLDGHNKLQKQVFEESSVMYIGIGR